MIKEETKKLLFNNGVGIEFRLIEGSKEIYMIAYTFDYTINGSYIMRIKRVKPGSINMFEESYDSREKLNEAINLIEEDKINELDLKNEIDMSPDFNSFTNNGIYSGILFEKMLNPLRIHDRDWDSESYLNIIDNDKYERCRLAEDRLPSIISINPFLKKSIGDFISSNTIKTINFSEMKFDKIQILNSTSIGDFRIIIYGNNNKVKVLNHRYQNSENVDLVLIVDLTLTTSSMFADNTEYMVNQKISIDNITPVLAYNNESILLLMDMIKLLPYYHPIDNILNTTQNGNNLYKKLYGVYNNEELNILSLDSMINILGNSSNIRIPILEDLDNLTLTSYRPYRYTEDIYKLIY